jgi:hypothetical protein
MEFGVWCLGFVGLEFGVWCLGFVGLEFGVWGLVCRLGVWGCGLVFGFLSLVGLVLLFGRRGI